MLGDLELTAVITREKGIGKGGTLGRPDHPHLNSASQEEQDQAHLLKALERPDLGPESNQKGHSQL